MRNTKFYRVIIFFFEKCRLVLLRPRHTMRQIAATRRRDRLPQQIASCDMWKSLLLRQNLSLRSAARIQTGLNSCDGSQRRNKGKRLVAATVQTRRLVASRVSALKLAGGLSHILSYCKVNNIEFNFVLQYLLKYTQKKTRLQNATC